MADFLSLWLPILVATVGVFLASSLINTVLPWHKSDFPAVPDEDGVLNALRPFAIPPGEYMLPRCNDMKEMSSPAYVEKMKRGPVMLLTVRPNGPAAMGPTLLQWAVYCLVVSALVACVASMLFTPETHGHDIFHLTAIAAFMAYAVATWQNSIWYGRPWSMAAKSTLDGLIYALITGAVFMWLWP